MPHKEGVGEGADRNAKSRFKSLYCTVPSVHKYVGRSIYLGCPSNNHHARRSARIYPLLGPTEVSVHWPLAVTRSGPGPPPTCAFLHYESLRMCLIPPTAFFNHDLAYNGFPGNLYWFRIRYAYFNFKISGQFQ
jgi:hypothetical protein